ncbi:MAG: acyl-CoA dehydrogenase [Gammaproteobacteria bacterium]
MLVVIAATLVLLGVFVRLRMPVRAWLAVAAVVFSATFVFTGGGGALLSLLWLLGLVPALMLLYAPQWRKKFLSERALAMVKKAMPPISQTEREAIDAGTVWWEAELFSGRPDWDKLFSAGKPALSEAEQAFLDGPVETLCAMTDDWQISEQGDLPPPLWDYIRRNGFFGLNASAEYGGLGFSAHAQSCIVQKLATRSSAVAVTVMVPNSLGPAELIEHYGSDEQKQRYLPGLARGEETPCFALTGPWAGSDAGAMPDSGIVCESEGALGFRLNWDKRYITLGPVATLIGLAFKAYDPDRLLGGEVELGITCALVPADCPGVSIGARHLPLRAAFQNGPTRGENVFIPLEQVIGGRQCIGQGWRMLMESLAAGRGISLPAMAAGSAKVAARHSGAYARVREQFGIEIGKFEGVQEALARIGGLTYLLDAARTLMTDALDCGEKPAVMSAMVKLHCTELSRMVINDAMDLHGGKGICLGRRNTLAAAYQQIPIGITVEGANILTRALIIFGQGALRCHPYLLAEIEAAADGDDAAALKKFDDTLRRHLTHLIANKIRSTALALSRGRLARGAGAGLIRRHTRSVEHLSAAFAFLADVTLLLLGGELKRREMLSGRFADAHGNLFLASAALKKFHDHGAPEDEAPLADWACRYALFRAQQALDGILRNYPRPLLGALMRVNLFGGGRYLQMPDDALSRRVAEALQTDGPARARLSEHMFIATGESEPAAQLEAAFALMNESRPLRRRLKKANREPAPAQSYADWVAALRAENAVDQAEADLLLRAREMAGLAISVDEFAPAAKTGAGESAPHA